ncbi:MAG: rhomboid family intramembrane serine protease [Kofleriaceae bacterium]
MSARQRLIGNVQITRGALIVACLEIGLSIVYVFLDEATKATFTKYLVATPSGVFEHGRVWTLATTTFLAFDFFTLLFHGLLLWMFVPTLERFWGTARFYRFVAITSLVGNACGVAAGYLMGSMALPLNGLNPFIYSSVVAFGIVYARQPVQFFGVLPLTGRQLMYGFIGFLALFIGLQQKWEEGVWLASAMIAAAIMTSKKWSPGLAWRKWRVQRARANLTVMQGGQSKPASKRDEQKWLN